MSIAKVLCLPIGFEVFTHIVLTKDFKGQAHQRKLKAQINTVGDMLMVHQTKGLSHYTIMDDISHFCKSGKI